MINIPLGLVALLLATPVFAQAAESLPIRLPEQEGWKEQAPRTLNLFDLPTLLSCVEDGNGDGLRLDLTSQRELLDGSRIDPVQIQGSLWIAPYPVGDAGQRSGAVQYRRGATLRGGTAALRISDLENGPGWVDRGQFVLRLELVLAREGLDRDLGTYELQVGFRREAGVYRRAVTVTEGPFVGVAAAEPSSGIIVWLRTDPPAPVTLLLGETRRIESPTQSVHEIEVGGLKPDRSYRYAIACDGWLSGPFTFRTAPHPGEGTVRFAFAGDSRQGPGGGERAFMGVNAEVLRTLLRDAQNQDVRFWVHGGDLVSGYTTSVSDLRTQFRAFKWIATPFLRSRPILGLMGNHDCVVRNFESPTGEVATLDRWPYATESSEAVFADELVLPTNAPAPDDPRRPSYRENVYSFRYGPVEVIALNDNYWDASSPAHFGGSPEGFLFPDQLAWLQRELAAAETDPAVHHILLCLQEPPFPNSAHLDDAMWYEGDMQMRGFTAPAGEGDPQGESRGVIDGRNELVRLAAASNKVVAILAGDEHNYSRMLLTTETPAGEPRSDDRNGDGKLDPPLSPLAGLARPVWCIISGGAGAPHYSEAVSPWNAWWRAHPEACSDPAGGYRFSMQNHWLLFEADARRISLEVRSVTGEVIDRVADLGAAVRRDRRR